MSLPIDPAGAGNPAAPSSAGARPSPALVPPVPHQRRWKQFLRRWGLVVLIATIALTIVALLGENVFDHAPGTLDDTVRAWALAHRTPEWLTVFQVIATVGAPGPQFLLVIAVAVWLWRGHTRDHVRQVAAVVLAAPIIALAFFLIVKQIVHRARPAGGLLLREVTFSFPSGHATASAAVFGTLAWVLAREEKIPWWLAIALAVLCPLLIGFSRIYLDVHWTTDVLAGWSAGAAIAALSCGMYEWGRRRRVDPA